MELVTLDLSEFALLLLIDAPAGSTALGIDKEQRSKLILDRSPVI